MIKLLVIGFDALDYQLLPLAGLSLRASALFSPAMATGPGWTSIYTGDGIPSPLSCPRMLPRTRTRSRL